MGLRKETLVGPETTLALSTGAPSSSFPAGLHWHSRSSRFVHSFETPNVLGQSTENYYSTMFTAHVP
jgi:hypothetical protein